jgi:hypothetical protein
MFQLARDGKLNVANSNFRERVNRATEHPAAKIAGLICTLFTLFQLYDAGRIWLGKTSGKNDGPEIAIKPAENSGNIRQGNK